MFFPDVNLLVTLTIDRHVLAAAAMRWYVGEGKPVLAVCRHTQLGMLRFITSRKHFAEDAVTSREALNVYDKLVAAGRLEYWMEPSGLEELMRERAGTPAHSPNVWSDAYLEAFARAARFRLVTFDVALARHTPRSVLLRA